LIYCAGFYAAYFDNNNDLKFCERSANHPALGEVAYQTPETDSNKIQLDFFNSLSEKSKWV
jgi:hypothetical protein